MLVQILPSFTAATKLQRGLLPEPRIVRSRLHLFGQVLVLGEAGNLLVMDTILLQVEGLAVVVFADRAGLLVVGVEVSVLRAVHPT